MFRDFCERLHFPEEAILALEAADRAVRFDWQCTDWMSQAQHRFPAELALVEENLRQVSERSGVHRYTIDLLLLLRAVPTLRVEYARQGLPESVFWETMTDLRCKLTECHDVYGVWGTFVLHWYVKIYSCRVVRLGRLEFEPMRWEGEPYRDVLKPGDPVVGCHIPSGEPCPIEAVMESFGRAYRQFGISRLPDPTMKVVCASWLLYPPHIGLFPENGNLAKFADLFRVISEHEREFSNFWRIFGRLPAGDFSDLPCDTSLRCNFADYLRAGNKMGVGTGLLLFDGEKTVKPE